MVKYKEMGFLQKCFLIYYNLINVNFCCPAQVPDGITRRYLRKKS